MRTDAWRTPRSWREAAQASGDTEHLAELILQVVHAINTPRAALEISVEALERTQDREQLFELAEIMSGALYSLGEATELLAMAGRALHASAHRAPSADAHPPHTAATDTTRYEP